MWIRIPSYDIFIGGSSHRLLSPKPNLHRSSARANEKIFMVEDSFFPMNLQDLWPEIRCDIEEGEEEGSAGEEETKKEKKKKRKERKKKRKEKGELECAREKGKKKKKEEKRKGTGNWNVEKRKEKKNEHTSMVLRRGQTMIRE